MTNNKTFFNLFTLIVGLSLVGCDLGPFASNDKNPSTAFADQNIPDGFHYSTTRNIDVSLKALNNAGEPISGVPFTIYNVQEDESKKEMFSGLTDESGSFNRSHRLQASSEEVTVETKFAGFPNLVKLPVIDGKVELDFSDLPVEEVAEKIIAGKTSLDGLKYLGDFNTHGKPFYLITPEEPTTKDFMDDVNASLPEGLNVAVNHPEYLAEGAQINTLMAEAGDVFVTFFHEGTTKQNTLGFYTYTAGNKPSSVSEIDTITVIFPNVSYSASGGNLHSGNRVQIGTFPANTEIGWVLFEKGWVNKTVTLGTAQYYSNPSLNPETNTALRQHNVLLFDDIRDVTVLGFEDTNRETGGSDNDFNDILFYVTSNPATAISGTDVVSITYTGDDADGDGIADLIDIYPNDPDRAYANYFPARNTFGSLAFEDLWPNKGDYDFNDLVVDYYFVEIMNGSNDVVEIEAKFVLKASGASFQNGFGFELPISQSSVSSIVGTQLTDNYINLSTNGLETGQDNAVAIVFDNAYDIVNEIPGYYLNTQSGVPYVTPDTVTIFVSLVAPLAPSAIGSPPYNPFMIIDRDRDREVHLPGKAPTTLAASSGLFDTANDASSEQGYYLTANNLPWALDIVEPLAYTFEKKAIDEGHVHFVDWAVSGGLTYPDWYKNKAGYRNIDKIYTP